MVIHNYTHHMYENLFWNAHQMNCGVFTMIWNRKENENKNGTKYR